ncbi:MAG: hypothetical protein BSOLF_0491 [Candidatus Carbobacillus altaicus]|uniref:Uncharacterized protein n=1 Tax=Candidatus Carbonibacillus altaicus TaxID=2163959 RepID=A0A2R6Y0W0_9BACL|nr:MAG: hypothetical protein BSOLF_0491 [Candidatus Carbobacillus altaicus]
MGKKPEQQGEPCGDFYKILNRLKLNRLHRLITSLAYKFRLREPKRLERARR